MKKLIALVMSAIFYSVLFCSFSAYAAQSADTVIYSNDGGTDIPFPAASGLAKTITSSPAFKPSGDSALKISGTSTVNTTGDTSGRNYLNLQVSNKIGEVKTYKKITVRFDVLLTEDDTAVAFRGGQKDSTASPTTYFKLYCGKDFLKNTWNTVAFVIGADGNDNTYTVYLNGAEYKKGYTENGAYGFTKTGWITTHCAKGANFGMYIDNVEILGGNKINLEIDENQIVREIDNSLLGYAIEGGNWSSDYYGAVVYKNSNQWKPEFLELAAKLGLKTIRFGGYTTNYEFWKCSLGDTENRIPVYAPSPAWDTSKPYWRNGIEYIGPMERLQLAVHIDASGNSSNWREYVIKNLADKTDYVAIHSYYSYSTVNAAVNNIKTVQRLIDGSANPNVKCILTEGGLDNFKNYKGPSNQSAIMSTAFADFINRISTLDKVESFQYFGSGVQICYNDENSVKPGWDYSADLTAEELFGNRQYVKISRRTDFAQGVWQDIAYSDFKAIGQNAGQSADYDISLDLKFDGAADSGEEFVLKLEWLSDGTVADEVYSRIIKPSDYVCGKTVRLDCNFDKECSVIAAFYDADGNLTDSKIRSVPGGETEAVFASDTKYDKVKLFKWSLNGVVPLANSKEYYSIIN